jgi:hypothetical protein
MDRIHAESIAEYRRLQTMVRFAAERTGGPENQLLSLLSEYPPLLMQKN